MAERRKRQEVRRRVDENEPLTKEEKTIAKHIRFNLPTKKGTVSGVNTGVEYFTASKAVDFLLDSKWATNKEGKETLFTNRQSVVDFLDTLLVRKLFYRAVKMVKRKRTKEDEPKTGKKSQKAKKAEKKANKSETPSLKEGDEAETEEDGSKKKKEGKRKVILEVHRDQMFLDGNETFVWVFDPVKPMTFVIGLSMIVGAIAVCLFPLWPYSVRLGVYNVSVVLSVCVGAVIALAIMRMILFGIVWGITFGQHYFWLFPNLMADVGFIDSFRPLYSHKAVSENTDESPTTTPDDADPSELPPTEPEEGNTDEVPANRDSDDIDVGSESESEHEKAIVDKPDRPSTGNSSSSNANGFEFVDRPDIINS